MRPHLARAITRWWSGLASVVSEMWIIAERTPCQYTLLGWDKNGTLYYRQQCRSGGESILAYKAGADLAPTPVDENSIQPIKGDTMLVRDLVRARNYGDDDEVSRRPLAIKNGAGLPSPDGSLVAIVSRYVYGPEDVIVVPLK